MQPEFASEIARMTLAAGGATVDVIAERFVPAGDVWYFPRHPGRTKIVALNPIHLSDAIAEFVSGNWHLFQPGEVYLGTWIHRDVTSCYLDLITHAPDKPHAIRLAHRFGAEEGRRIVAICNPASNSTHYL